MGRESGWYRDAVIYQLHVRAFRDSDGDGIGDFAGLTEKLPYLQDLGVTAVWLLPFYPSPLRDDGYDIADYRDVHPDYGTLDDFRTFLGQAHGRGMRVITELVLNHTSDRHDWFQNARRDEPGGSWRDFYVWSDDPERYSEARIIFRDFESSNWTWDSDVGAYYWHRFYSHQPDLNFDNPRVHDALLDVVDFWLEMGVDGMRLDAVPYLYEREGTNCENLPETHRFLKKLRRHVEEEYPGRMLLAEANQWPEDAVEYFGDGDECHMCFHFPVMPRLFMGSRMEDRFPIVDIMEQTPEIPDGCQWAMFLRNHDELTLEMVTDEERDYMYRVYAEDSRARINLGIRRRLAPLLENNRKKIELMYGLLFSLPGSPVIYYGDEIGMGDNIFLGDRNGVRTPMQWSGDRNAGFSEANPQRLYLPVVTDPEYRFEAVNVESQRDNPTSLYWWVKRLVGIRKRYSAFGRGDLEFVDSENRKVLAFLREHEDETMLVVANLSRFVQYVRLELGDHQGFVPVEVFGQTEFPVVEEEPYPLTLGPHAFYWLSLEPEGAPAERERAVSPVREGREPPVLRAGGAEELVSGRGRPELESALGPYIAERRWFASKSREIQAVRIEEAIALPGVEDGRAWFCFVDVELRDAPDERYSLPLAFVSGREEEPDPGVPPAVAAVRTAEGSEDGLLVDGLADPATCSVLLRLLGAGRELRGEVGSLLSSRTPAYQEIAEGDDDSLRPRINRAEQSNSSVIFGDRAILKVYRRLQDGVNPDVEVTRFLTERGFEHTPPLAGELRYRRNRSRDAVVAMLQAFVENEGDAWEFTEEALGRYFERALARQEPAAARPPIRARTLLELAEDDASPERSELIGTYLEAARLIGRRTAEMHRTLADARSEPDFRPRPFTALDRREVYQSMRNLVGRTFRELDRNLGRLPDEERSRARAVIGLRGTILDRLRRLVHRPLTADRIRTHGDYHLGQLLHTGKDFVVIDFEGEPTRSLEARRSPRSALRDVAGMLRSFHYAARAAVLRAKQQGISSVPDLERMESWAESWTLRVGAVFLSEYVSEAEGERFVPADFDELCFLVDAFLLEKAVYELGYEMDNRPAWTGIPLDGIWDLVGRQAGAEGG